MTTARSAHAAHTPAKQAAPAVPATGLIASWTNFWFAAVDPIGLHAVRVLACLLFLGWLLPFATNLEAFFGLGGWFDAQGYAEASRLPDLPANLFSWSVLYLCGTDPLRLALVYWSSLAVIVLFALGIGVRLTSVLTWVIVVSFTASPVIAYDADPLLRMLAFYLMFGYLLYGQRRPGQSLAARLIGPCDAWLFRRRAVSTTVPESVSANLAVRLFQVHFAIAMVASGLHKLQIKEWWAGVAPWFYLNPPFRTTLEQVQSYAPIPGSTSNYLILFSLGTYLMLAWQICFPAFAWRPRWRPILLGGALLAWLACILIARLPVFGPIMVVACLSYLTASEWRWAGGLFARLPGLHRLFGDSVATVQPLPTSPRGAEAGPTATTGIKASSTAVGHR
jgi:hypothetical protein